MSLENLLERSKEDLARRPDFTIEGGYNLFARNMDYSIDLSEFEFAINRMNINADPRFVRLIFNRFDSNQDGRVSFDEYKNQILPKDPILKRDVMERAPAYQMGYETRE